MSGEFFSKLGKFLICGGFNYCVNGPHVKPYSADFLELVEQNNVTNHLTSSAYVFGHTLDLVLSPFDSLCLLGGSDTNRYWSI